MLPLCVKLWGNWKQGSHLQNMDHITETYHHLAHLAYLLHVPNICMNNIKKTIISTVSGRKMIFIGCCKINSNELKGSLCKFEKLARVRTKPITSLLALAIGLQ